MNEILNSLQIVLQGVRGMPEITRRQLLQWSVASIIGNVPVLAGSHVSEEERLRLCESLTKSIKNTWELFHSAGTAQVLAVGQALLALVQQNHAHLPARIRPLYYTSTYDLIGVALHVQERNEEALLLHDSGYIAALSSGDAWYVASNLVCQADCYHALGKYDVAIERLEEALRIIGQPIDEAFFRLKAHLLTCWADNAMMLTQYKMAQEKFAQAEGYLDYISPNEEFDRASWLLVTGKYALIAKDYKAALTNFEEAFAGLPAHSTLRRTMTAIGLTKVYACMGERDRSVEVAETLVPMMRQVNARMTDRWFTEYIQHDLLRVFPTDVRVQEFVTETYKRLPHLSGLRIYK